MRTIRHVNTIAAIASLLGACNSTETAISGLADAQSAAGGTGDRFGSPGVAGGAAAQSATGSVTSSTPANSSNTSSNGGSSTGRVGSSSAASPGGQVGSSSGGAAAPTGGNPAQSQTTSGGANYASSSTARGGTRSPASSATSSRQGSGGTSKNGVGGASTTLGTGGTQQPSAGGTSAGAVGGAASSSVGDNCSGTASYPLPETGDGYSELPDGRCGKYVESVAFPPEVNFDKAASLAAFKTTLYPVLTANCSGCHNTANTSPTGAQGPIHADQDPGLAHEYALARVNLRNPDASRLGTRMTIDRHNCFGSSCKDAGAQMLTAIKAWAAAIPNALPAVPWGVPKGTQVAEADIIAAIKADKAKLSSADAPYAQYVSFHEIHNSGASAEELNMARVGLSKTLNSVARWAPKIANPTDVDGRGIIYRFDMRWYWGYNKGVTKLLWGGSDDDLSFGTTKDVNGNAVSQNFFQQKVNFASSVSEDANFANLVWARILKGNVEGARQPAANISGFKTDYVEAGQLAYTLSRPDVYNSIMVLPPSSIELENELGVDRGTGITAYQWVGIEQAITKDSRLLFRAKTKSGGMYYKTFDIFSGQEDAAKQIVNGHVSRWPFWANPIPKAIAPQGTYGSAKDNSFFASLAQYFVNGGSEPAGCDGQTDYGSSQFVNCRYFTGSEGLQESAEEVIWDLPNGLQGYELVGAFNQRRVDAFNLIVTDFNIHTNATDKQITTWSETQASVGDAVRLNTGSSCFGCHIDGMNRFNNNMRDWLEAGTLPMGAPMGADKWVNDQSTVSQVKALYPATSDMRPVVEADRKRYIMALATVRKGMMLGPDKNLYGLEPTYWLNSWTKKHYSYKTGTQSND
jgi:hypothetical protein